TVAGARVVGQFSGTIKDTNPAATAVAVSNAKAAYSTDRQSLVTSFRVDVAGKFPHTPGMGTPVTNVKVMWAKGTDPVADYLADYSGPIALYWNTGSDTEQLTVPVANRPAGATHIIVAADLDNKLAAAGPAKTVAIKLRDLA